MATAAPATSRLHGGAGTPALTIGALGVVFGDIGTSPLYTLNECLTEGASTQPRVDIFGILSLVFWALTLVVTVKYLTFIMRADNKGEGGIFALLALLPKRTRDSAGGSIGWAAILVVVGAALLYGDGMITPAISVLSAMEGLRVATPALDAVVLPATCVVLVALFALQRRGTGHVGALFGPVMALWFLTIGTLGAIHIVRDPAILGALSPVHGVRYFVRHGPRGILVLGAVVLAVTGGEALYADLGHFGRRPIRIAWMALVMPALVLCYFGQGALILAHPLAVHNPFYGMVPQGPFTYALVVLSTAATVIASQALISGAFSLTHQAMQLGYFPRVEVRHTSESAEGQIYVPEVNHALAIACVALVLAFRYSSRLAAAYGIAVTGTMTITSVIYFEVTRATWRWPAWKAVPLLVLFLSFDIPFFVANLFKFLDGGYVPIVVAAALAAVMVTWNRGRRIYVERLGELAPTYEVFCASLSRTIEGRIEGSSVFLTGRPDGVPMSLEHYANRIRVLPRTVILLTIDVLHEPHAADDAMRFEVVGDGVSRLTIERGFMDLSHVPPLLERAVRRFRLPVDLETVTYVVGRQTFLATSEGKMGALSEKLFAFLARNARSASEQFGVPPAQVIEIGSQMDL
jgi:KUP system potassium uptake protein